MQIQTHTFNLLSCEDMKALQSAARLMADVVKCQRWSAWPFDQAERPLLCQSIFNICWSGPSPLSQRLWLLQLESRLFLSLSIHSDWKTVREAATPLQKLQRAFSGGASDWAGCLQLTSPHGGCETAKTTAAAGVHLCRPLHCDLIVIMDEETDGGSTYSLTRSDWCSLITWSYKQDVNLFTVNQQLIQKVPDLKHRKPFDILTILT